MTTQEELQKMIYDIYDLGEWMMERTTPFLYVKDGNSDNMKEHIRVTLNKLNDTIVYLQSKQKEL